MWFLNSSESGLRLLSWRQWGGRMVLISKMRKQLYCVWLSREETALNLCYDPQVSGWWGRVGWRKGGGNCHWSGAHLPGSTAWVPEPSKEAKASTVEARVCAPLFLCPNTSRFIVTSCSLLSPSLSWVPQWQGPCPVHHWAPIQGVPQFSQAVIV